MNSDCTANSHYLTYTSPFKNVGRKYVFELVFEGWDNVLFELGVKNPAESRLCNPDISVTSSLAGVDRLRDREVLRVGELPAGGVPGRQPEEASGAPAV